VIVNLNPLTHRISDTPGHGHKGFLVLADYAMLTYLFVWCEWFREHIFALYPLVSG